MSRPTLTTAAYDHTKLHKQQKFSWRSASKATTKANNLLFTRVEPIIILICITYNNKSNQVIQY